MSNNLGPEVSGKISLDSSDFPKALKEITNFEKSMVRAVNQINQGNTNLANSINKLVGTFGGMGSSIDKTTTGLKKSSETLKEYSNSNKDTAGSLTQTINAVNRTEVALMKLENRIQKSSLEDENKAQALKQVQGAARTAVSSIEQYGAKSSSAATQIAKFKKEQASANIEVNNANRSFRGQAFDELSTKFRNVSTSVVLALGPLSGVASRLVALQALFTRNAAAMAGFLAGITAVTVTLTNAFKASVDAETQYLRMESTLNSLGIRAKLTASDIMEMGHAVAAVTLTSAKDAREGALAITSFSKITTDSYESILITAQGMAEQLGGGLADNAKILARALQEPEKRLTSLERKVGDFSAVVRRNITDMARSGNIAGAQAMILAELSDKYDLATSAAMGYAGAADTTSGLIDRLYEKIGLSSGAMEEAATQTNRFNQTLAAFIESEAAVKMGNLLTNSIKLAGDAVNALASNMNALQNIINAVVGLVATRLVMSLGVAMSASYGAAVAFMAKAKAAGVAATNIGILNAALGSLLGPMGIFRIAMIALAPIMGSMITRFVTTKTSAEDVTEKVREYRLELDKLATAARQLSAIDPKLGGQAKALEDESKALEKLEERLGNADTALQNFLKRPLGADAKQISDMFDVDGGDFNSFVKSLASSERVLSFFTENIDKLTESQQIVVHEFNNTNKALASHLLELSNIQGTTKIYNQEVRKTTGSIKQNTDAIVDQLTVVDNLRERIDGVTIAVEGWSNTYDSAAQAALRLTTDLKDVDSAIATMNEGISLSGENIELYAEELTRLLRIKEEIERRIRGEIDDVSELTASYYSMTNSLRTLTRDTDNLRDVFLGGEDRSFLNAIDDQVASAKESLLSLSTFEIMSIGESMGIARGTMDLELYRTTVADVYGEKLALEVEAQQRLREQIALQAEVDNALKASLPSVLEMDKAYEALFQSATKLGDEERMEALRAQYQAEQDLVEAALAEMLEFRIGATTDELEQIKEIRLAQLEAMYGAEHELYKKHLEDMTQASKSADMFAGVMDSAQLANDTLVDVMDVMKIQNREQTEQYKKFAKAQILVSSAIGIGKTIENFAKDPIGSTIKAGIIAAKAGAQIAAIDSAGYKDGGYVSGAGTSTSDSIAARLSNGEFVMKAAAVNQLGLPFLNALNEGRSISRADGGSVGNISSPSMGGGGVNIQIIDQRRAGSAPITTETSESPDGVRNIRVIVRDIMAELDSSGERDRSMANNFGVTRQPKKR